MNILTVNIIDPLTTAFCVAQLKYRGGPILVSEKKGCQLCHNTFSEPECACLPGGRPVHIHCVAKKALNLPVERQHENAHRSNHTWSWWVPWGSRHRLASHLYRTHGEKAECIGQPFRAHARPLSATKTCKWVCGCLKYYLFHKPSVRAHNTDSVYENILMNIKNSKEILTLSFGWSF